MSNGTRTITLSAVIALVLGLVIGWLIHTPKPGPSPEPTPVPTASPTPPPSPTPVCRPNVTPGPGVNAKDWNLTVGPDPCLVVDGTGNPVPYAVVSRGQGHKIVFHPSDPKMSLAIVIHAPASAPRPFKNLTFGGWDPQGLAKWVLVCDDPHGQCSTGPAKSDAQYGCYKYDQILDGKECDAGIIIEQ